MSFIPLLLMWMWSRDQAGKSLVPTMPSWPTAASPPPPMPAFHSQPPPASMVSPSADTATPLAQLHAAPPVAPHADAANTLKAAARQGAKSAASKALHAAHIKAPHISNPFGKKKKAATSLHPATVEDLQTILISRGAHITKDGLYGPKTASAWASLAKSKKLDTTIKRVNPTVANVAAHTFDVLSVPAIP